MLGGLPEVHNADISASKKFLAPFLKSSVLGRLKLNTARALDCGAGIGRITKHFLSLYFDKVDLVEPVQKFITAAKTDILKHEYEQEVVQFYCCGLQDMIIEPLLYDLIWCQWSLCYLTDNDLVNFFSKCGANLKDGGLICIKENISRTEAMIDEDDSSVTRSDQQFKEIFSQSNLTLLKERKQDGFPKGLYPVKMYALIPKK